MKILLATSAAVVLTTTAFADPIHDAAKNNDLAGVQAELDKGVDVNVVDRSFYNLAPLHYAAGCGFKEIAELLIAEGADVDAKTTTGGTPLFNAAGNNKEIVELLIANGADVNVKLKLGSMIKDNKPYRAKSEETTLHEVARSYSEKHASEVCELLIANGAKVNELNDKGQTPIDEAFANGRKKTAEFLRKHGGKTGEELKAEGKSG